MEAYILFRADRVQRPKSLFDLTMRAQSQSGTVGVVISAGGGFTPLPLASGRGSQTAQVRDHASTSSEKNEGEHRRTIAAPLLKSQVPGHEAILDCRADGTLLNVRVLSRAVESYKEVDEDALAFEALVSLIINLGRTPVTLSPMQLLDSLEADLAGRLVDILIAASSRAVLETRRAISNPEQSSVSLDPALRNFDLQLRASSILASFSQFDNRPLGVTAAARATLETAISLGQLVESNAILRHQKAVADFGVKQATAEAVASRRSERLSRVGASFLLPTLWYGLLGANVFPNSLFPFLSSDPAGFWIAISGGVLAAFAGYFFIGKLGVNDDARI